MNRITHFLSFPRKRESIFGLLLFALALAALPLCAQEATLSVPLHSRYTYNPAGPLFTLQHTVGATGHLQEWKNTAGAVITYVDAAGNINIGGGSVNLMPSVRPAGAYAYLIPFDDHGCYSSSPPGSTTCPLIGLLTGTADQKTYGLYVNVNRPSTAAATGDSNDATVRFNSNTYGASDGSYILRGINQSLNARSGSSGYLLEGALIGATSRSGSTWASLHGATVDVEQYSTLSEIGGIDVLLKPESNQPAAAYGVRVRNEGNSTAVYLNSAFSATDTGANTGYLYGLDFNGATINAADARLHTGAGIYSGSADPNGALSATDGSIYLRTGTATASTVLYVCTGTTTWAAIAVP